MGARLNSESNNGFTVFHDNYFPLRIGGIRMQHVYADRRFRLVILVTRCLPSFSASPSICLPISSSFIIGIRTIPSRADSFHYVRSTWPYVRSGHLLPNQTAKLDRVANHPTRYFSIVARNIISLLDGLIFRVFFYSHSILSSYARCIIKVGRSIIKSPEFPLHFSTPSSPGLAHANSLIRNRWVCITLAPR